MQINATPKRLIIWFSLCLKVDLPRACPVLSILRGIERLAPQLGKAK
jgi:hypothetical protein